MKIKDNMILIAGCVIAILILWAGCSFFCSQTVQEYSQEIQTEINSALSDPNNAIRKKVESAHGTVTTTTAHVSKIQVITKDGSNNAGKRGSNVSEVKINIMVRWDGIVHKNGYTEFHVTYDVSSGKPMLKNAGIVATNALVNLDDPKFWSNVAVAILTCI